MLARARLGDGLRNTAQSCVQAIVRACFRRLKGMTPEDVERLMEARPEDREDGMRENGLQEGKAEKKDPTLDKQSESETLTGISMSCVVKVDLVLGDESIQPMFTPYGLPTILELLRVLIALLNPSDQAHTDSMRLSALAILNTALEVGGASLGNWPELREGVRDEGCRYLFQVRP